MQEPLRKIQTFATLISENESNNLSETGKDNFHRMQAGANRMQRLIEDLLVYSRTNSVERKFENVNLKLIVEEVKANLKEEIMDKQAIIEIGEMCSTNIIPFQLHQLLYNLIGNSLKFSSPHRLPIIKIECETALGKQFKVEKLLPEQKYCNLRISDNGIGFEQQYSEKIFTVFARLHGKSEYKGTGIGLSIVKKIVENHNGAITAIGVPDVGATFDIYIPTT